MVNRILKKIGYSVLGPSVIRLHKNYRPIILMYHGVTMDSTSDGRFVKHVKKEQFALQLQTINRVFQILPLGELVEIARQGFSKIPVAAITFDDGFLNNYEVAAPILDEYGVTACFYLATGYIDSQKWMWTDYLEHAIYSGLPEITSPGGHEMPLKNDQERSNALERIKAALKNMAHFAVEEYIHFLKLKYPQLCNSPYGNYAFMRWEQVRALYKAGHTIGAHTVNHPMLSKVSEEEAQQEILYSRSEVEKHVGACSEIFCYPNGKKEDYSAENVKFVAKHFKGALSTLEGYADYNECYEMRRIGVGRDSSLKRLMWVMTDYATR